MSPVNSSTCTGVGRFETAYQRPVAVILRRHWPLVLTMMLAAWIFTYGAGTGATQTFYVDEWFYDRYALELVQWLVLRQPVQFGYIHPSGYSLTLAGVYGFYYLFGRAGGQFTGITDFLVHFATQRADFVVLGRLLSAGYALAALPALYWLALRMFDQRVAILSVLAVTFSYPIVFYAHLAANITMLIFLAALASCWIYQVCQRGNALDYLLAGALIGAGIGTKYYPALLFVPLGLAHLMRLEWSWRRPGHPFVEWYKMVLAGLAALLAAVIFFPLPVFAYDQWRTFLHETLAYYTGGNPLENAWRFIAGNPTYWAQTTAEPVSWWANSLRVVGEMGLLWLGFGLLYSLWRFPRRWLILATPFLLLFTYQSVRGGLGLGVRQLYFALPLLWVLAAAALVDLIDRVRLTPRVHKLLSVIAVTLLFIQPVLWTARYLYLASRPTTADIGRAWLLEHVPNGSIVLVDSWAAPFGETIGWHEWQDRSDSVTGSTEDAIREARAAAAPPFQVVNLAGEDAHAELHRALSAGKPVFVVTTDYYSTAYWQAETRLAWGNLNEERIPFMQQYYREIAQQTEVVHVVAPRDVAALGPIVTISEVIPLSDK